MVFSLLIDKIIFVSIFFLNDLSFALIQNDGNNLKKDGHRYARHKHSHSPAGLATSSVFTDPPVDERRWKPTKEVVAKVGEGSSILPYFWLD